MYNEIKTHFHRNFLYQKIKERPKPIIHLCTDYCGWSTFRDQPKKKHSFQGVGQFTEPGQGRFTENNNMNAYLDSVYRGLLDCHKELLEENRVVSSDAIKSRYLGEDDNSKT